MTNTNFFLKMMVARDSERDPSAAITDEQCHRVGHLEGITSLEEVWACLKQLLAYAQTSPPTSPEARRTAIPYRKGYLADFLLHVLESVDTGDGRPDWPTITRGAFMRKPLDLMVDYLLETLALVCARAFLAADAAGTDPMAMPSDTSAESVAKKQALMEAFSESSEADIGMVRARLFAHVDVPHTVVFANEGRARLMYQTMLFKANGTTQPRRVTFGNGPTLATYGTEQQDQDTCAYPGCRGAVIADSFEVFPNGRMTPLHVCVPHCKSRLVKRMAVAFNTSIRAVEDNVSLPAIMGDFVVLHGGTETLRVCCRLCDAQIPDGGCAVELCTIAIAPQQSCYDKMRDLCNPALASLPDGGLAMSIDGLIEIERPECEHCNAISSLHEFRDFPLCEDCQATYEGALCPYMSPATIKDPSACWAKINAWQLELRDGRAHIAGTGRDRE